MTDIPSSVRTDVALVTGGAGFIGKHLCARLRVDGREVHATSRQSQPSQSGGVTWWHADMADMTDVRRVLTAVKPDIVFHLAGSVGASPDRDLVMPTYHSLVTSTINMMLAAPEHGCNRIILAGSFTEPLPHADYPVPGSPYAAAKWASCAYGRMFHALYGTPVVILRPFMTYGPAQNTTKLIPSTIRSLLRGDAPKLSSGRVQADWVYIADVVEAFLIAVRMPGIEGSTFDLGTGKLTTIRTVVEELATAVGTDVVPLFGALPDRPAENEIAASTEPTAEQLGWRATTALADGLRDTVAWYRGTI